MFSLRFGSSHVSMFNCIYKIKCCKMKFEVSIHRTGTSCRDRSGALVGWAPRRGSARSLILPRRTRREAIAPRVRPCLVAIFLTGAPASKLAISSLSSISDQERPALLGSESFRSASFTALSRAFVAAKRARITCGLLKLLCAGRISPVSGLIPFARASMISLASSGNIAQCILSCGLLDFSIGLRAVFLCLL